MKEPQVTVVIPTHNRPELLKHALDSVYAQTFTDYEVIVVDDGDSPQANSVLSDYLSKENFIYLETKKNQGAPVARNIGIKRARGEFVAFLDDDDEWVPDKLSVQHGLFKVQSETVGFSFTAAVVDSLGGTRTFVKDGVHNFYEQALTNFKGFLTITLMARRNVLLEFGGFDESMPSHQDPELILRISGKYQGLGINQPLSIVGLYDGRDHIGKNIQRRIDGRLRLIEKHKEKYSTHPQKLAKLYFQVGLWYRDINDFSSACLYFKKVFLLHKKPQYFFHLIVSCIKKRVNFSR